MIFLAVSTKKSGTSVLITVSDNGNGIPEKGRIKFFNPSLRQNQQDQERDWV